MPVIDLEVLTRGEVSSLSGHDRGLAARQLFKLDELDGLDETVDVVAPSSLDAITPSFVQGMFARSAHTLGKDRLFAHFNFKLPPHLLTDVQLGIQRALMRREIAGIAA